MHLKVSETAIESKNEHIKRAVSVFIKLLKTSQSDN